MKTNAMVLLLLFAMVTGAPQSSVANGCPIERLYLSNSRQDDISSMWKMMIHPLAIPQKSTELVKGCCGALNGDLNQGAGGDDIFLHAVRSRSCDARSSYISDLRLTNDLNGCNGNWQRVEGCCAKGDLNNNAGGEYIYLCALPKSGLGDYVEALTLTEKTSCPIGFTRVYGSEDGGDLNDGARGKYIYLCQKKRKYSFGTTPHWELVAQGWIPSYEQKIPSEWKSRGQFITSDVLKSLPEGFLKIKLECGGKKSRVSREISSNYDEGGPSLTEWHHFSSDAFYRRFIVRTNEIHCNLDYAKFGHGQKNNPYLGQWGRVWVSTTGHLTRSFSNAPCDSMSDRQRCLMTRDSRNLIASGVQVLGAKCAWCINGPCTANNGNRCEPINWLKKQHNLKSEYETYPPPCEATFVDNEGGIHEKVEPFVVDDVWIFQVHQGGWFKLVATDSSGNKLEERHTKTELTTTNAASQWAAAKRGGAGYYVRDVSFCSGYSGSSEEYACTGEIYGKFSWPNTGERASSCVLNSNTRIFYWLSGEHLKMTAYTGSKNVGQGYVASKASSVTCNQVLNKWKLKTDEHTDKYLVKKIKCVSGYIKAGRYECDGSKNSEILMFSGLGDNPGSVQEQVDNCAQACIHKKKPKNDASWNRFVARGFIVKDHSGRCWCESEESRTCKKVYNAGWTRYDLSVTLKAAINRDDGMEIPPSCVDPWEMRRALEDQTPEIGFLGGMEIAEKFDEMFHNLAKVKELKKLEKDFQDLHDEISRDKELLKRVLSGEKVSKYLDGCLKNVRKVRGVTDKLMGMIHKIYENVGYIGQKIEENGYKYDVQMQFGEYLGEGVDLSDELLEDLKKFKKALSIQREDAEKLRHMAKEWKKDQIAQIDRPNPDHWYWLCLAAGPLCPGVAAVVELHERPRVKAEIKKAESRISKQQNKILRALKTNDVYLYETLDQVCAWRPEVERFKMRLERTNETNENLFLLPELKKQYYKANPEREPILNGYTVDLLKRLKHLQETCEEVDGFEKQFAYKLYKVRVPAEIVRKPGQIEVNSYSLTTTYNRNYPAINCFDGNMNTMCHGKRSSGDFLKADISRSDVSLVRIHNRKDCCQDRIKNAEVMVDNLLCGVVQSTEAIIDVSCPRPLSGTSVWLKTKHYLNIMQLEIFKNERKPETPKNCEWSWSEWSSCSKNCKGGLRSRTMTIKQDPTPGGYACPENPAYKACNRDIKCPCKESLASMEGAVVKNPEDQKVYYIAGGKRYLLSTSCPMITAEIESGEIDDDRERNFCQEIKLEDECVEHEEWPLGGAYHKGIVAEPQGLCVDGQNEVNMGVEAAYAMKIVYDVEEGTVKMKKGDTLDFGWKVLENHSGPQQGGWRALVWEKSNTCLVSFKGTSNWMNWVAANLIANPHRTENVNVHWGFYKMAEFASEKLRLEFGKGKHCAGKKVVVTGHSLGAAVAEIFSWALLRGHFNLKKRSKKDVTTITFAQPQTFLKTYKTGFLGIGRGKVERDCPDEIHNNPRSYRYVLSSYQGAKTVYDPLPYIQLPTIEQAAKDIFLSIILPIKISNPFDDSFDYTFKHCTKGVEIQIDHTESKGLGIYKKHDQENWPTGKGDFKNLYADTNAAVLLKKTGTSNEPFSLHLQHRYKRAMDANEYDGTCKTNYN